MNQQHTAAIFFAAFSVMLAASLAFTPHVATRVTHRAAPSQALYLSKSTDNKESLFDKAMGLFQKDDKPDKAKERENTKKFQRRNAATQSMLQDTVNALKEPFSPDLKKPLSFDNESDDSDVDEHLLNRLRVSAEKTLSNDEEALKLLGGGESVEMGNILSRRPSTIVVDGGRPTQGIRSFIEVKGKERNGTALVIGDRRGVLLLKLTVGGMTLDVKADEGLDLDIAHGVKKLRP